MADFTRIAHHLASLYRMQKEAAVLLADAERRNDILDISSCKMIAAEVERMIKKCAEEG